MPSPPLLRVLREATVTKPQTDATLPGDLRPGRWVSGCPSDLDLACFVDDQLDAGAHGAIVEHLDTCDECRDIVATVIEALYGVPTTPAVTPGASAHGRSPGC